MASMADKVEEKFETFFNGWLIRQENFLQQLVQALTSQDAEQHENLVQQVLTHYEQYSEEKSKAAREEVLLFLSPPWFSSFEKTLLWIGGFKPFSLFKILANSVTELTREQHEAIEQVKYETRREERELTAAMATVQESVAAPALLKLARRSGRLIDGEKLEVESAMESLKTGMVKTLERADKLRGTTVKELIEILSPVQTLKFLAASADFQLRARKWGFSNDQHRATGSGIEQKHGSQSHSGLLFLKD